MKKRSFYFILIISLVVLSLTGIWKNRWILNGQPALSNTNYTPTLDSVKNVRSKLKAQKLSQKELEGSFIKVMTNKIFPYWYGTNWDYNGTTQVPNKGNIACGYFVTTTLRDAGVPIKRITLAQYASEKMIKSLISEKYIHRYSNLSVDEFETKLNDLGAGLYLVGLDNHTGYLLVTPDENYFIHSSGSYPFQVVKERTLDSKLLVKSKYRVVGRISSDPNFIAQWING